MPPLRHLRGHPFHRPGTSSWTPQSWPDGVPVKRRFLFLRLAMVFGGMFTLFLAAVTVVSLLIVLPLRGNTTLPGWIPGIFCGLPLLFLGIAALMGATFYHRVGSPIAEVMAAADAVAEGKLDTRVAETARGEIGRLERSFNRMTSELARSEQQRRNLTADVAHELRTPLHIIQGNLEGILDGIYEPSKEHINATLDETRHLARLVNDLQTLSLAESGQLPLHPVQLAVDDVLDDVITSFSGQASAAGIQMVTDLPGDDPLPEIDGDPDRLNQVFSNLVSNAIRHTPAGGRITLRAAAIPGGVRVEVQDTGAGIPPDDLPYIFDRFWRGDRARTRQAATEETNTSDTNPTENVSSSGNSGLGLAITRQLVQAHGGTIRVESEPGKGTIFIVDLLQTAGGK